MRIGVLATVQHSMFSSGMANTSLAVAELMRELGHEVTLIHMGSTAEKGGGGATPTWWDDCRSLAAHWKVVNIEEAAAAGVAAPYDLVFEVDRMTLSAAHRAALTRASIWLVRKPFLLGELEASLFPTVITSKRDFTGLTETWIFDSAATAEVGATQVIELLTRRPVRIVPYLWTPSIATAHLKEGGLAPWIHATVGELRRRVAEGGADAGAAKMPPWIVHVAETNTSNSSSAVVPLVILREAKRRGIPIDHFRVHNADMITKSKFFAENTVNHCVGGEVGLSGEFVGRQRCVEWVREPMSCVLSHIRFSYLRPMLLDCAWAGIPLVHNSVALREIGCGLERGFYSDNHVGDACDAFYALTQELVTLKGAFAPEALPAIRKAVLARWSPLSVDVQGSWRAALEGMVGGKAPAAAAAPAPAAKTTRSVLANEPATTAAGEACPTKQGSRTTLRVGVNEPVTTAAGEACPTKQGSRTTLRVGFIDMWDDFNPAYNFFTLALTDAGSRLTPPVQVIGGPATATDDVVFFGPFGDGWRSLPAAQPKIHFTGENTPPVAGEGVKLNLGFRHFDMATEDYLRFPLWILEIDWFGADAARIQNPKPIPLECCTTVDMSEEAKARHRKNFCAFVVSNPSNPIRNAAFHWLSSYKGVDSAGRLFNNIGDRIFAGAGGGGGEIKKLDFFHDYKFALTYENNSARGYTTEKYLHAKAAGCIPIYWGDPTFERDFDVKGCIDARDVRTPQQLIDLVRRVDTDDVAWEKLYAVPALDSYKVAWCQRTMAEMARRVFTLGGLGSNWSPVAIGDRLGTAEPLNVSVNGSCDRLVMRAAPAPVPAPATPVTGSAGHVPAAQLQMPVVTTYSNRRFLPSLQHWLTAIATQRRVSAGLRAIVYLDPDIPADSVGTLEEKFSFVEFRTLPSAEGAPDGAFPDFWAPEHYGWKLWILRELVEEAALKGQLILYMDAGTFLCRWPKEWMLAAQAADVCLLEDPRQENARWCTPAFCQAMMVTEKELAVQQIQAATICFRAGTPKALALFLASYEAAKSRDVLVGPKWLEPGPDGAPRGHRHDQSILSILSHRMGIARIPVDSVQCATSLRKTFMSGCAIYTHRGAFQVHRQFASEIDEAYVINLDRRADRMERLWGNHPDLVGRVERYSAVEGKELRLTPALAKLLAPNDFFWKKAVTGCALSHLGLWWKLATDNPDIKNYLILEDDVKLKSGWEGAWKRAVTEGHVPDDYDILYLGGVLPPNRAGWEATKERVNDSFVSIAENTMWGQAAPTRYFHFCAYAYVLSRRGAEKVLGLLESHGGYWTSADHILCNPVDVLKAYVLDPVTGGGLLAGCYQDEDPKYAAADFNNFSRIDSFDSDLWNNDERWTAEEVAVATAAATTGLEQPIDKIIAAARGAAPAPAVPATPAPAPVPAARTVVHSLPRRLLCLEEHALDASKLHEFKWLLTLFGNPPLLEIERVQPTAPPPTDSPIVIAQRPHTEAVAAMLERWDSFGAKFHVLHLSDEYNFDAESNKSLQDPIEFYELAGCQSVLRFYLRPDIPAAVASKVTTIPLGYHWTLREGSQDCLAKTPHLPFRETAWSFFGTGWCGRKELLAPLDAVAPNKARFFDNWNDAAALKEEEYIGTLLDSVFIACPDGMNPETYRFYEALECGCIPLLVRTERNAAWIDWVTEHVPIAVQGSWAANAQMVAHLMGAKPMLEAYRDKVLRGWMAWRAELKREVGTWLAS